MGSPRCVLVDDDRDFAVLVRTWLSRVRPHLEVVLLFSGLEALGYMARHHVDLLITDYKMPMLDGLRLTTRLRATDSRVPIVVMSGDEVGEQALSSGASAFLPKRDIPTGLAAVLDRLGFGSQAAGSANC